jgi:Tat protein secretion system quality control protein TatD with DNase activity
MTLADIGANLTHSSFREDLDAVLARSREAGVQTIIVTGTSVDESGRAAALADAQSRTASPGKGPSCTRTSTWTSISGLPMDLRRARLSSPANTLVRKDAARSCSAGKCEQLQPPAARSPTNQKQQTE